MGKNVVGKNVLRGNLSVGKNVVGKIVWGKMSWGKLSFGEKCYRAQLLGESICKKSSTSKCLCLSLTPKCQTKFDT